MSWGERGTRAHGQAKKVHRILGATGLGDAKHAQREPGDPRHVAHHTHEGLGHGVKAFEGVLTWGEKVMWTGIKWGVVSAAVIGGLTALTHNTDALHSVEGYFDLSHDALYAGGAAVWDVAMMVRRGWKETKAIFHEAGQAIDHGETAVRSAGKLPGRIRKPRT